MSSSHSDGLSFGQPPPRPKSMSAEEQQLKETATGALNTAQVELITKQRIIDEVLEHLQRCMKEKSELAIQNNVLQTRLNNESIESQRLQKACHWYKTQLYDVQKQLRSHVTTQAAETNRSKAELEKVKIQLRKTQSECDILHERLSLEREKRRNHELDESRSLRHDSKDSGIYSESNVSDTSSELVAEEEPISCPSKSQPSEILSRSEAEVAALRQQLSTQTNQHQLDRQKLIADHQMLRQQKQLQETLLNVQQKNLEQFREELEAANKSLLTKQREHDAAVTYLAKCRQQVDQLGRENRDIHRESMQMILKFESVAAVLTDYRQEIRNKDDQIRLLTTAKSIIKMDRSSQASVPSSSSSEKANQTTATGATLNDQETANYHKNLLKVIQREYEYKLMRRESNMRTLLKKLREEMRRNERLQEEIKVFMQQVLPGEEEAKQCAGLNADEMLRRAAAVLIIPRESSQSAAPAECKLCPLLRATEEERASTIAQLKKECLRLEGLLEEDRLKSSAQVGALEAELKSKSEFAERARKTIDALELEQQALHCSLHLLKQKLLGVEQQVLEHARNKDTAESERVEHHQLMVLLMQIKNERDEFMCQNEGLNKLLRGLLTMQSSASLADRAKATLKRSANYESSEGMLRPISEGIQSVQKEVKSLNSAILWGTRGEVSLLDELQAAISDEDHQLLLPFL